MKTGGRSGFRGVWPVVQRELREEARRPFNHWLRIGGASGGMFLFCLVAKDPQLGPSEVGIQLFMSIHALLMVLICCLVPAMTADCIAREKRDGTLGLLFLTPLTAGGIVAGKGAIQSLRTLTLWLAVLPVLVVPVLTGGVSWTDGVTAITIEFCATVLCLAAGLLASSSARGAGATFVLAEVLGCILVSIFGVLMTQNTNAPWSDGLSMVTGIVFSGYRGFLPDIETGVWNEFPGQTGMLRAWLCTLVEGAVGASLIYYFVVKYAARRIEISWQDSPRSARQEKLERQYCTPVFQRWFARRTKRAMDRNPIVWLQQYSWKTRVGKWGACLFCVVAECFISTSFGSFWQWEQWQEMLGAALGGLFTFVAVNGFLREKEAGSLELMLSTPLSANQIIWGRIRGLWQQSLPSAMVCGGSYFLTVSIWHSQENGAVLGLVAGGFLSLPFFATYFALSVKNVIVAVILTWLALFLATVTGVQLLELLMPDRDSYWTFLGCPLAGYAVFALPAYFRLRRNLSQRRYSF